MASIEKENINTVEAQIYGKTVKIRGMSSTHRVGIKMPCHLNLYKGLFVPLKDQRSSSHSSISHIRFSSIWSPPLPLSI